MELILKINAEVLGLAERFAYDVGASRSDRMIILPKV